MTSARTQKFSSAINRGFFSIRPANRSLKAPRNFARTCKGRNAYLIRKAPTPSHRAVGSLASDRLKRLATREDQSRISWPRPYRSQHEIPDFKKLDPAPFLNHLSGNFVAENQTGRSGRPSAYHMLIASTSRTGPLSDENLPRFLSCSIPPLGSGD